MVHKNPAQKNVKIIKTYKGPIKRVCYSSRSQKYKTANYDKNVFLNRETRIYTYHCPILTESSKLELRRGIHMLRVKFVWTPPKKQRHGSRSPS